MKSNTTTVAKINNTAIMLVENGSKMIPIKPICEALGVDYPTQFQKIKDDQILSSTIGLSPTVGADGKQREMACIPLKYVFGWLFTINPKNVAPEAQESVLRYRMECYEALFSHFAEQSEYLEQKQMAIEAAMEEAERIRTDFKQAKTRLDEANHKLSRVRSFSFEQWKADRSQLMLMFPDETE
jgi:exonuclease VII small subunit